MPWLATLALAYTENGSAPFWERVMRDPMCDHIHDCGYPGISQEDCKERGCCWDPIGANWCSGEATKCSSRADCSLHGECVDGACVCDAGRTGFHCAQKLIKKVHVIQSCHLDVGFTNLSAGVIDLYLNDHIPKAIRVAAELRNRSELPEGWRLKFLAQSFYVNLALDCPVGMGFTCPNAPQREALRAALRAEDITYHAFPHNAELENTSPVMLELGFEGTQALDETVGLRPKRFLSQRDVPGLPRSVIPLLKQQGVELVTVGVNGASMYPRVPKLFRWRDPVSNDEVLGMWHPRGYGGYTVGEAVMLAEFDEALVTDWNVDNGGPRDADDYVSAFVGIQAEFPNATIVASTFDDWLHAFEGSGLRDTLPVVDKEVGDSWLYGVPSDPKKVAQSRALDRALTRYLDEGGVRDAPLRNFSRLAIKNCEHTWGLDVKSTLLDDANWTNAGFESARNGSDYLRLEQSWWEQRRWGFEIPLSALPADHRLAKLTSDEIGGLEQPVPYDGLEDEAGLRDAGFQPLDDPAQTTACGTVRIRFDAASGAVTDLEDISMNPSVRWASTSRPLFELQYRTYSGDEFRIFQDNYYANESSPPDWFQKDFGKPNMTVSVNATWRARLSSNVWHRVDVAAGTSTFLLRSAIVDGNGSTEIPHAQYGAPASFVMQFVVQHAAPAADRWDDSDTARSRQERSTVPRVEATLWSVDKTPTRLPESCFVGFVPEGEGVWEMQKLGQWQRTTNDVVDGGSKHLHGVSIGNGIRFTHSVKHPQHQQAPPRLAIELVDAPVVNLGEPLGFPVACTVMDDPWAVEPDVPTYGVSSMLWNNLWGTNYVQWYPFHLDGAPAAGQENFISRYNLVF